MPGHLDQQSQEDEQRHRQQDEVRHALVHAADHHHHGHVGGGREIGEGRQSEGKGDRHAGKHHGGDQTHEEDEQIVIAERAQNGCECQQQHADGDHRHQRADHQPPASHLGELQHRHHEHQHRAHGDRGGPPGVLNFQRRGRDIGFLVDELKTRVNDQQQEGERGGDRHHVEEGPHRRGGHADEGRHAHMLTAPERHHRPQHGEPQEQDRGQLVRPDEGLVKDIARDHAGEQDDDLGHDQSRRRDLDQRPQRRLQPAGPVALPGSGGVARRHVSGGWTSARLPEDVFNLCHAVHTSLPAVFSRMLQASSPYLAFQSR